VAWQVGMLREHALFFVWDTCMVLGWGQELPGLCVDLCVLCRRAALDAKTAHEAVEALQHALPKLYAAEVREAWRARDRDDR
jgi:hypothetical protein